MFRWIAPLFAVSLVAFPLRATDDFTFVAEADVTSTFADARWIHVVDFDRDGDLDVFAASGILSAGFSYFENLGGGSWAGGLPLAPSDDSVWDDSQDIATGDLDNDGDLDVVASGLTDDDVSLLWWENEGDLATATSRAARSMSPFRLEAIRLLDMDGDADLDILATQSNELLWLENDIAGGTLTDWTQHSIGFGPDLERLEVVDLDRDGDFDLVTPDDSGDAVTWWENTAGDASAWSEHTIDGSFAGPRSVVVADFDRDGDPDVAAAGNAGDLVAWWANDGDGGGWSETAIAAAVDGPRDLRAADLDRDGDIDLVGSLAFEDRLVWWENADGSGGSWTQHSLPGTHDQPEQIELVDLDRDGRDDVLAAVWFEDSIARWSGQRGAAAPLDWTRQEIDDAIGGVLEIRMVDLDRDGDLDLVGAGAFGTRGARWWENLGDGTWADPLIIDAGLLANHRIGVGDIDGDGDPDVVVADATDETVSWRENRLDEGLSWIGHSIGSQADPSSVVVLDVDGDGDHDVAVGNFGGGGELAWWSNDAGDGSAWTEGDIDIAEASSAHSVFDWDLDGDPDLVGVSEGLTTDGLSVWENPTFGSESSWRERPLTNFFPNDAQDAATGDLDRDGMGDPVLVDAGGEIIAWLTNAGGERTGVTIDESSTGAKSVVAADFDHDGDADLAVASDSEGTITYWENDGTGTGWTSRIIAQGLGSPEELAVADVDRDGTPDLVVVDRSAQELFWLRTVPTPPGALFSDGFESGDTAGWSSTSP